MKKLLSASLFAAVALSATAYEVGDFAYTKTAKYKIIGADLVKNGKFTEGTTGLDGWTAFDEVNYPLATTFMVAEGGPNGSNYQIVQEGGTALEAGMYQVIDVAEGGVYVVALKVMGAAAGYTDLDLTGGNTNYINAYYNTDGAFATVDGTSLLYGTNSHVLGDDGVTPTNGICGGYGFDFTSEGFSEAVFAVEATADGKIIIDLRGMAAGLSIADVCCHKAEEVYDNRIAENRIAYFQKYLQGEGMSERTYYDEFQEYVGEVEAAIEANATPEEMAVAMQNLEGVWEEFAAENFENMMDIINGGEEAGNSSANWMYWTSKFNKLVNEYQGKSGYAPWTFTTDRWCHKTAAAGNPMRIEWNGKWANSTWNNIATLTTNLSAGTYFWGLSAYGGPGTLNKARWAASTANPCAETKLFFNGDTILIDTLNTARYQDYVLSFTLEEDVENATFGIICNNVSATDTYGFYVNFINPVLYKLKVEGELSEEQKAYLGFVQEQLDALAGRIEVATGYASAANDSLPWGKELLNEGIAEAQARYDAWAALTQDEILENWMDEELSLKDTIMNNGVRYINNNYITPFLNMNAPFPNLLASIDVAQNTLGLRIYSNSAKKSDLEAEISKSQAMYNEKLAVAFSSEDSVALDNQKIALDEMVVAFKNAITTETIIDIDFGTQDAPAVFVENVDPEGLVDAYWSVDGAKGTLTTTSVATAAGTTQFELGYGAANDENGVIVHTDSLGMLRIGNGEAVINVAGAPVKATDIVSITFDYYFGKFTKYDAGYKVLTAEGDTICGLFYCAYDGNVNATRGFDTFGVNGSYIPAVGASNASNAAIAAASNKTTFQIVLDYGMKTMYCVTTSTKGTYTTSTVAFGGEAPAQVIFHSTYTNSDRRCWVDNVKVQNIAAGAVEGGNGIQAVEKVSAEDGVMYNVAGLRIQKPVKGQLYIQNGRVKVAK